MSNQPPSFKKVNELKKLIHMEESARAQYLAEKTAKIQPFLNENATIASLANSAINAVVLAQIQNGGVQSVTPEVLADCLKLAKQISDAQQVRKWEGFRDCLVDQREAEVPGYLVWAADKFGVDVSEAAIRELIAKADAAREAAVEKH